MENFNLIEFHEVRDFSKKINVTFEFLRQNFKSLGKSILIIAGPCALIASLLMGSIMTAFTSLASPMGQNEALLENFQSVNFWMQYGFVFILLLLGSVMTIATIYTYVIVYGEKKTNQITVHEIWERVRGNMWMYLGSMVLYFLLLSAVMVFAALVIGGFSAAAGGSFVIIFFLFFGLIGGFFYFLVATSMTFFIQGYEGLGFFSAMGRSMSLISGKWWSTFGLLFILQMIAVVVSYIIVIPFSLVQLVTTLHQIEGNGAEVGSGAQIVSVIAFSLQYVVSMLLTCLPHIGIIFQYFNLVERKESKGLLSAIENIGQPETTPPAGSQSSDEHEQY